MNQKKLLQQKTITLGKRYSHQYLSDMLIAMAPPYFTGLIKATREKEKTNYEKLQG